MNILRYIYLFISLAIMFQKPLEACYNDFLSLTKKNITLSTNIQKSINNGLPLGRKNHFPVLYGATRHLTYSFLYNHTQPQNKASITNHSFKIEKKAKRLSKKNELLQIILDKKKDWFIWYENGDIFISPKNERWGHAKSIEDLFNDEHCTSFDFRKTVAKTKAEFASTYEIHIIPKDLILFRKLNQQQRDFTNDSINSIENFSEKDFSKAITIYVKGKDIAQKILDDLYETFKGLECAKNLSGEDIRPVFSAKVSGAPMYVTQGNNGNIRIKSDKYYQKYFDRTLNYIYYAPDFEEDYKDYKLYHPENHEKPLTPHNEAYIPMQDSSWSFKVMLWFKKHIFSY